jgi:3-isopropylmalate/(R)-2-methylmalate dehydratase small subunit
METIRGRVVYKLSDDINTDKILAGRYLVLTGDKELAEHCFEGHIDDWNEKVEEGDILVAGENFGCGSSREHAPIALKGSGIAAVVAESFGRIFYRNSIAVGLPVIQATGISGKVEEGDTLEIDVDTRLRPLPRLHPGLSGCGWAVELCSGAIGKRIKGDKNDASPGCSYSR